MGILQELWADRIAAAKNETNEGVIKTVKRGLAGWNKPGQFGDKSIGGDDSPAQLVKRNKGHDDDVLLRLKNKGNEKAPKGSPQALQNKVIDRELKKRGISDEADVKRRLFAKLDDLADGADEVEYKGKKYRRRAPRNPSSEAGTWRQVNENLGEETLTEAPTFAMDDIPVGGTVIYKTSRGFYKMSKVKSKRDPFTLRLESGDTIENNAVVSTDASDWKDFKDKKIVKEDTKLQDLGRNIRSKPPVPDTTGDVVEPVPADKSATEPAFKVGNIVKPLIGPHKGEPHEVVKVFDDGKLAIKPKGLDDKAIKYTSSTKQAKVDPKKVELSESKEQSFSIFKKGSLLSQVTQKLLETKWSVLIEYGAAADDAHEMQIEAATAAEALEKAQLWVERNEIFEARIGEPQRIEEAVAGPLQTFKKGQKVIVKKTGEEVEVMQQSEDGLVFTKSKDAVKIPDDKKLKIVPGKGYKEYMPRELEIKQ